MTDKRILIKVEPRDSAGHGRLHYSIPDEGSDPPVLLQSMIEGYILVRGGKYADSKNEWSYRLESVESVAPLWHTEDPLGRTFCE